MLKTYVNGCEVEKFSSDFADILKIQCNIQNEIFFYMCIYRLQSTSPFLFLEEFQILLESEKCKNLIVLGDYKIDILDNTLISDSYQTLMVENGLKSLVNEPTRPCSGTCLDHVFGRFDVLHSNAFAGVNLILNITDHCMTGLLIKSIIWHVIIITAIRIQQK